MAEDANWFLAGGWRRRANVALAVFLGLLLIFHRPLLLTLGEKLARHFAANEHLKLDLRLEGSVFTNLVIRNLHVTPTGPSPVEAIDVRYARVSYSLFALLHGIHDFFRSIDVESARIVLDPDKDGHKKKQGEKSEFTLPAIFPDSLRLSDVSLVIRDKPNDTVIDHVSATLDPKKNGELQAVRVKFFSGQEFSNIAGQTSYSHRNLIVRNLRVDDDHFDLVSIDGSRIAQKTIVFKVKSPYGGGQIDATGTLRESHRAALWEGSWLTATSRPSRRK